MCVLVGILASHDDQFVKGSDLFFPAWTKSMRAEIKTEKLQYFWHLLPDVQQCGAVPQSSTLFLQVAYFPKMSFVIKAYRCTSENLFITIAQGCQEITVKESIWRLHPGIQIARLKHCSGVTFIVRLCLMLSCAISPSLGMELHETDFPVQINTELKI